MQIQGNGHPQRNESEQDVFQTKVMSFEIIQS
jgi:hypothetical protein